MLPQSDNRLTGGVLAFRSFGPHARRAIIWFARGPSNKARKSVRCPVSSLSARWPSSRRRRWHGPMPRHARQRTTPRGEQDTASQKEGHPQRSTAVEKRRPARHAHAESKSKRRTTSDKESKPALTGDLALVRTRSISRVKGRPTTHRDRRQDRDPAAQKLVEWFILRHSETTANFSRYAAFIAANPEWPSAALLRRRAEARLWQDAATPPRSRLHRRPADQRPGQTGDRAHPAREGDAMVPAGWCATHGGRRSCPSASRPRRWKCSVTCSQGGSPRAHGQADRGQGCRGRMRAAKRLGGTRPRS